MGQNDINPYDKRIIRRSVVSGLISEDERKKHMESLPDDSANADWVTIDPEEADLAEPTSSEMKAETESFSDSGSSYDSPSDSSDPTT